MRREIDEEFEWVIINEDEIQDGHGMTTRVARIHGGRLFMVERESVKSEAMPTVSMVFVPDIAIVSGSPFTHDVFAAGSVR
jgi:hypothetical protein